MSKIVMVDQEQITRAFYDGLTPFEQGYASYFQACWKGSEIPDKNPYPSGSAEYGAWNAGQSHAVIAAIDAEE
jgi:hypothetical protein